MRLEDLPEGATIGDLLILQTGNTDLATEGAAALTTPQDKRRFSSELEELEYLRAEERRWMAEDATRLAAQARAAGAAYGRGEAEPPSSLPAHLAHLPTASFEEMEIARSLERLYAPGVKAEVEEWCRTHQNY